MSKWTDQGIEPGKTPHYVMFGDVARNLLGQQCQYASRHLRKDLEGYLDLSEQVRWLGDPCDYHFLEIHEDDVEKFVSLVKADRKRFGHE